MSTGQRVKGTQTNNTGQNLSAFVLQDMSSKIRAGISQRKTITDVPETLAKYEDDPRGFITQVLKQQITEDVERLIQSILDNEITEGRSANGVGKTNGAAALIVWFFLCRPFAQVYCTAAPPEDNLRRLLWGEISKIIERNPGLFINTKQSSSPLQILKSAQEFVAGVTIPQDADPEKRKARFSGKHAPNLLFVIDEGDGVPPEIYEAIESCMSGGYARLLVLFNPRKQSGPVYQMEKNGDANVVHLSAFRHPNVVTGNDIIPGAVTRQVTVRRIHEWTRKCYPGEKLTSDVFRVPGFLENVVVEKRKKGEFYPPLEGGLRKVTESAFSYMVLGEYPSIAENQLISKDWLVPAQERWKEYVSKHGEISPLNIGPKLSLDVAEFGDDLNVETARYEYFVPSQRFWSGVDIVQSSKLLYEDARILKAEGAWIDANGLGSGVPPLMKEYGFEEAYRIMVQEAPTEEATTGGLVLGQFERIRDQGFWTMREWLKNDPRAMLPPCKFLEEELLALTYSRNTRNRIKIVANDVLKDLLGRSIDRAFSLMLTFCPIPDDTNAGAYASANYMN